METVHVLTNHSKVLGTAKIVYHAAHGCPKQQATVEFIPGNYLLVADDKETKPQKASWRLDDEDECCGDEDVCWEPSSKRRRTCNFILPSDGPVQSNDGRTLSNLSTAVETLSTRMVALERRIEGQTACTHDDVIDHIGKVFRTFGKRELLRKLRSPPSLQKRTVYTHPVGATIVRDEVTAEMPCDFQMFKYVLQHIEHHFLPTVGSGNILFSPPIQSILHSSGYLFEADLTFRTAAAFFHCLGLHGKKDLMDIMKRRSQSETQTAMRILGGVQWSTHNEDLPLHIFYGESCAKEPGVVTEGQRASKVIGFVSTEWDDDNSVFCNKLERLSGNSHLDATAVNDRHAFGIEWRALPSFPGMGRYSKHALSTEGVQHGTLVFRVPCVMIRCLSYVTRADHLLTGSWTSELFRNESA